MFLSLEEKSVSKVWIKALQSVLFKGDEIKSQYDKGDDLPTRDVTSAIHVLEPFSEPYSVAGKPKQVKGELIFCHPADIYCIEAIKGGYLSEVMAGDRDNQIWESDTSYPYTYHDRLFNYKPINKEDKEYLKGMDNLEGLLEFPKVDQIEEIIKQLKKSGYTRRAEAITWRPLSDNRRDDPPCLQRIWCRIFDGKLRMNAHWRSRDLFGAWEANVNGMLKIASHIAEETNTEVGEYFDFCDSLHIYGRKKLVYKEIVPLLDRVRQKEGLVKQEYSQKLDKLIKDAENWMEINV